MSDLHKGYKEHEIGIRLRACVSLYIVHGSFRPHALGPAHDQMDDFGIMVQGTTFKLVGAGGKCSKFRDDLRMDTLERAF